MDSILKPISPTSAGSPGGIHDAGPAEMSTLEATLKYSFGKRELLEQALTHSSQARERDALSPGEPRAVDAALLTELAQRTQTLSEIPVPIWLRV